MKHQIQITSSFCYGHRLLGYNGKCCRLHGHNGRVEFTLDSAGLDSEGFVVDFTVAKELVKKVLDHYDHFMILQQDDPMAKVLFDNKEPYRAVEVSPTAENLAELLFRNAQNYIEDYISAGLIQDDIRILSVKLYETENNAVKFGV